MPEQPFRVLGVEKRPVDINVMKRNMTVAKGFLDISLLSANASQLRNIIRFGNEDTTVHYLILTGISISIILQVSAGILLLVGERFDINREDEQHRGDLLNTLITCLIFIVLIINVFVACLGVDVNDPNTPPQHHPYPYPSKGFPPTSPPIKDIDWSEG
ncbi:ninjurin-1-like [Portunus trituberculatus]|uniref:ninjurin-1-like n=1 Tax=Portunus trituberculatus TaxID=210409 RepID=UPI001E1CD326|nr:ninjurin-1-like [Portunus trituberculatus]XP_045120030.1 ninjurin-1-like [Portunus trituberculatus]